ncbi:DNA translocase FtsK [Mesobacillus stamsii]|uniref:S-DNA-T family DNA segregation ATPase FtsK/SpoIIIE n=1 Tax=Mesobacillus stamsii TaxID=225347 RepID=A0ABU0FSY4_9BACI|nr:DNA translocase FtsK [Mesobacillus stamsii]MDQ0413043.1 S-DNA-T family DNA segregation ATPase FtsK/SpoIIIE [Mesobacillus stamsii]
MSWIKKIMAMFQNDDDEVNEMERNQKVPKLTKDERNHKKDLEAKVVYQYPKGQFRFPLIPDEKLTGENPRHSRQEWVGRMEEIKPFINERGPFKYTSDSLLRQESTQRRNKAEGNEEAGKGKAPANSGKKDEAASAYSYEPKKVSGPKRTQPFKPTEIPSPIYAFNRPPKKEQHQRSLEEVEYEMTEFETVQQDKGPKPRRRDRIQDSLIQQEQLNQAEMLTEIPLEKLNQAEMQRETPPLEKLNQAEIQEETPHEKPIQAEIQEETPHEKPNQAEILEEALFEKPIQAEMQTELPLEKPNQAEMQEETPHEKPNQVEKQENLYDESTNQYIEEELAQNTAPPLQQKGEEPKRQLPFNVLMLKQDKRKWEERKTSNYPSFMTDDRKADAQQQANEERKEVLEKAERIADEGSEAELGVVYDFPPLNLLNPPVFKAPDPEWIAEQENLLNETLKNFNVGAKVVNVTQGPAVTRFEVQPEPGVKVNKITNLSDDIKLSLAAKDIRIEAPIPGKHTIGIEVPNHSSRPVLVSEILQSSAFMDLESPLSVALGLDIAGNPIVTDLKKMPHGLIAGATGSGKSVCINTMLVSLLYKAHPEEVKLLLIDPKMVELAPYNRIPHLVSPVITDVKAATAALKWAVEEMERRYELFAHTGVRDISRFNELADKHRKFADKLPYIVIVIDELADLMMMAPGDVEEAICRIAQKARACGIHLIIATQRPSVDVITGLIKANVPTRIAFSVSSQVDSRTIIDISGAEKLLGRGDMLFLENGSSKPFRLQGTYVTDQEIDDIIAFVREQRDPDYLFEQDELLIKAQVTEDEDELFYEACEFVIDQGGASTSSVQRRFKIGYNRAARLIEMMEQQGFISEGKGSKPRDVLITATDLDSRQESSTSK